MKIKPFLKIMLNPFLIKERTSTSIVSRLYKAQANSTTASMKPPNILLYTPGKDSDEANNAITLVKSCLSPNFYTVYPITSAKFYRDPWAENTHTVVIWCSESYLSNHDNLGQVRKSLQNYLKIGGNVLLFNCFSIFNASTITFEPFSKVNVPFFVKTIHGQKESVSALYYPSHFITDASESPQPLHQINTKDHSQSVSVLVNAETCGKLAISMLPLLQNPAHESAGSAVNLLKQLLSSLGLKCIDSSSEISKLDQLSLKLAFLYSNSSSLQEKFITSIRNIPKFQLAPFNDATSI
uniref:Biotin-protein ligase N-terminal domain-containing protein n=1 Tax=Ciona savignyi TaxID=51511 RepID=H2ZC67_CIOSA